MMWFPPPYYEVLNLPTSLLGVGVAAGALFGGAGSQLSHLIHVPKSNRIYLSIALGFGMAIAVLCGLMVNLIGLVLLVFGGSFIFGITYPRVYDAINKRVESSRRATIISFVNLLRQLMFIPLSLLVGWLVDTRGVSDALYACAIWLLLAVPVLLYWRAVDKREAA